VIQCIKQQIACLKKPAPADDSKRKAAILTVSACNQGKPNRDLAAIVQNLLYRDRHRIPEASLLFQVLAQEDADRSRHILVKGASMIWVVSDPVFDQHLEGIFHMENRKRTQALASILADEPFSGRIIFVLEGGYSIRGIRECGLRGAPGTGRSAHAQNRAYNASPSLNAPVSRFPERRAHNRFLRLEKFMIPIQS
jgi:hypothetical protein